MMDFIESLPGWLRLVGFKTIMGLIVVIIVLAILYAHNPETAETPERIEEIKENVTDIAIKTSTNTAVEASAKMIQISGELGAALANDVKDPRAKKGIKNSAQMLGSGIAIIIVSLVLGGIATQLGKNS